MPVINGGLSIRVPGTTEKAITIQRAGAAHPVFEVNGEGQILTGDGSDAPTPAASTASQLYAWQHFR